jgi:hypothetical protein
LPLPARGEAWRGYGGRPGDKSTFGSSLSQSKAHTSTRGITLAGWSAFAGGEAVLEEEGCFSGIMSVPCRLCKPSTSASRLSESTTWLRRGAETARPGEGVALRQRMGR